MEGWLPVIRQAHLQGGCRAINGFESAVSIDVPTLSGKSIKLNISSFHALFPGIQKLGIGVIGCDFFRTEEEAKGFAPPEWRAFDSESEYPWIGSDQGDIWSFLANAAFKQKYGLLCDLAGRISHQLRSCNWRLRQLSDSYANQLRSSLYGDGFRNDVRFMDGYTSLCFLAIHAFLIDACVLRDYLAEFYAWNMSHLGKPLTSSKITSMGRLAKILKTADSLDLVGQELQQISGENGWLHELGAYRDLIIHVSPLSKAGKRLMAITRAFDLPDEEQLPGIKIPLPNNPVSLFKERDSGRYFNDDNLDFARFLNAICDHSDNRDSLEYAHECFLKLALLAKSMSTLAPVSPDVPEITPGDIIGDIKIINKF